MEASLPTYRIGPSDFFTSGDLEADADTLNAQINRLNSSLTGNEDVPSDFDDGWSLFTLQWKRFYEDKFGGFFDFLVAFNNSNRDELIRYEREYAAWYTKAAALQATPPDPQVAPSTGTKDTFGDHIAKQAPEGFGEGLKTIVIVLVVGVVVVAVAWKAL